MPDVTSKPDGHGRSGAARAAVVAELERLALDARGGDAPAMARLIEALDASGEVRLVVRRLLVDAEAARDVCQDVLIVVAVQLAGWQGRGSFLSWVREITRHKTADHLRSLRPSAALPDGSLVSDQHRISSLIATRAVVQEAVRKLPERYRAPVWLRDVEQLDYPEVATRLDITVTTVRARVSRGRAMVAAFLGRSI